MSATNWQLPDYWDFGDGYWAPEGGMGCITTLPVDPPSDVIEALHRVVAEVTGKPVEQPQPARIGFL